MEEVVRFFWERSKRAWQMDEANRLQGKPTHTWITSTEWTDAFKSTLSNKKLKEFDKAWDKFEAELQAWHDAPPKKQNAMKNPLGLE